MMSCAMMASQQVYGSTFSKVHAYLALFDINVDRIPGFLRRWRRTVSEVAARSLASIFGVPTC